LSFAFYVKNVDNFAELQANEHHLQVGGVVGYVAERDDFGDGLLLLLLLLLHVVVAGLDVWMGKQKILKFDVAI
jgi:hypothetical protein